MNDKIFKYVIPPGSEIARDIQLPKGAQMLSVGCQVDEIVLWARVDPDEKLTEDRVVDVYRTGERMFDPVGRFLGTAQFMPDSRHYGQVYHIFEGT